MDLPQRQLHHGAHGIRLQAAFHPQRLWGNAFPLRKVAVQYAWTDQSISRSRAIVASKYAMEIVRQKWVVTADATLFRRHAPQHRRHADWRSGRMALALSYRWSDRTGSGNESYGLLDARLTWEGRRFSLYADADNVLNASYHDFSYIPQPGIWLTGGMTLKF